MPHILIDLPIEPSWVDALQQSLGTPVTLATGDVGKPRALPESELRDAEAILCNTLPANHDAMTSLQMVQIASAGFKQVEGLGLSERGVSVCTASGVNDVPIAEWVVLMMLSLRRNFPQLLRNQAEAKWDRDAQFQTELRGMTLGIWGYGGIGREAARLAKMMGLTVHVLTRSGKIGTTPRFHVQGTGDDEGNLPDRVFSAAEAEAFCATLDYLVLAIPETPDNLGLIGAAIFEALPDRAFLLNPARGKLVHEQALFNALRGGQIAGAALDTHFHYPMPADHPLWTMDNVVMTPHISGSSQSPHFTRRLWELFVENLRRQRNGEPLLGQLAARQLDPPATDSGSESV